LRGCGNFEMGIAPHVRTACTHHMKGQTTVLLTKICVADKLVYCSCITSY